MDTVPVELSRVRSGQAAPWALSEKMGFQWLQSPDRRGQPHGRILLSRKWICDGKRWQEMAEIGSPASASVSTSLS